MKCHAFTLNESSIVKRLKTNVYVFDKYLNQDLNLIDKWIGIWDTGATTTCITATVATKLGLIPTGTALTSTAGGDKECNTYCVDILLPNNIIVQNLTVYEVHLNDGDMLIGMDIIKHGDFSITNFNRKTKFSFRIPSMKEVDYVDEIKNSENNKDATN